MEFIYTFEWGGVNSKHQKDESLKDLWVTQGKRAAFCWSITQPHQNNTDSLTKKAMLEQRPEWSAEDSEPRKCLEGEHSQERDPRCKDPEGGVGGAVFVENGSQRGWNWENEGKSDKRTEKKPKPAYVGHVISGFNSEWQGTMARFQAEEWGDVIWLTCSKGHSCCYVQKGFQGRSGSETA